MKRGESSIPVGIPIHKMGRRKKKVFRRHVAALLRQKAKAYQHSQHTLRTANQTADTKPTMESLKTGHYFSHHVHHIKHHIRHIGSHISLKHHENEGIKVLIWYTFLLSFAYFLYFIAYLSRPSLQLIKNQGLIAVDSLLLIIAFGTVYAMHCRKRYAWILGISWYFLMIAYSIWFTYLLGQSKYGISKDFFILFCALVILINSLVMRYISLKRDYFIMHRDEKLCHHDKMFIYMLISFWVILLLISSTIAIGFYRETRTAAEKIISELKGGNHPSVAERKAFCSAKQGDERDVCYLVLAAIHKDRDICSSIVSDFYKFSCSQMEDR